jgi:hypothetical protein
MDRCRDAAREILMRIRTVVVAAAVAAVVAGVSGVAVASSGSPSARDGVKAAMAASPTPSPFGSKAVAVLAAQLGISADQARHVLDQIQQLSAKGSIEPSDPAFVAIARDARVTTQQLASALDQVKKSMAPEPKGSAPGRGQKTGGDTKQSPAAPDQAKKA